MAISFASSMMKTKPEVVTRVTRKTASDGYVTKEVYEAATARIAELEAEIERLRALTSPKRDRAEYMREYRKRKEAK